MRTLVGRPRAWKRTWPHRQPPSRTTSSAISISFSSRLRALYTSPRPDRVVLDGPGRREAATRHDALTHHEVFTLGERFLLRHSGRIQYRKRTVGKWRKLKRRTHHANPNKNCCRAGLYRGD